MVTYLGGVKYFSTQGRWDRKQYSLSCCGISMWQGIYVSHIISIRTHTEALCIICVVCSIKKVEPIVEVAMWSKCLLCRFDILSISVVWMMHYCCKDVGAGEAISFSMNDALLLDVCVLGSWSSGLSYCGINLFTKRIGVSRWTNHHFATYQFHTLDVFLCALWA